MKDSNQYSSNFVDIVTDPNNSEKPEIFQLSVVQSYINYWSSHSKPATCTVCQYAIKRYKIRADIKIESFMMMTNEFAQKMPENIVGVIFTWLFMRHITKEEMTDEDAFQLDPVSILFHNIIGCCDAEIGMDASSLNLCTVLQSSLMQHTDNITNTTQLLNEVCNDEDSNNSNSRDSNEETKIHQQTRISADTNMLIECIRGYVESAVSKKKSKLFSCKYIPGCLYDNNGHIDKVVNTKSLPHDCRIYVSYKWVENALKISYDEFMHSDNYIKYQPGIYQYTIKENTKWTDTLFEVSLTKDRKQMGHGFVAAEAKLIEQNRLSSNKYIQEHCEKTKELKKRISYVLGIIEIIPESLPLFNSPITIISNMFPLCKFCALCIEPRMRLILNDVYVMGEKKAYDVGIGTGFFGVKVTPIETKIEKSKHYHSIRKHDSQQATHSLGFSKNSLSTYLLEAVFEEWFRSKFPFLDKIIAPDEEDNTIKQLQDHQDPNASIYCAGNIRRIYTESDLHQEQSSYRCFIIYAIKILKKLLKLNVRLSKEKSTIKRIAHDHNIPISLVFN